ncbi:MFS transporter [Aeromicrobium sp. A1-2]|uniref:MFS transporter n=1 Tax=Aeromicrobium sp. A1-2 TaxID=2107713 RepID=UPI001C1F4759|nr:MFS transporter [Aeromicrobium sp. A1-2]
MSFLARVGHVVSDIRPLRESPAFRRLWFGQTISQFGQQMTVIAIAFQVYGLTGSSFKVGLVGLCGLAPLVLGGLYGGALVDAYDRRLIALWSAVGLWVCSGLLVAQAYADVESVGLLYAIVALQAAFFAVNNPARSAMLPRLLPAEMLPAANALGMASFNLGFTVGPLVGGLVIGWHGVEVAYTIDAITFGAALYALVRLPSIPPLGGRGSAPGLRSVVEGLRFLASAPNLRMTFIVDLCAMIFAQPRALFPALAITVYAGNASTLGLLQAAPAIGSLVAFAVSGSVGRVRRQGIAIVVAIAVYGVAVAAVGVSAIGLPGVLWLGVTFLALSGAADMISASYRSTILQTAAPDELRGRLQGVFVVVVAGGPRLGDFVIGSIAAATNEEWAMIIGGVLCLAGLATATVLQRRFLTYDTRNPTP